MSIKITKSNYNFKTGKYSRPDSFTSSSYNWTKNDIKRLQSNLESQGLVPIFKGYYDKKGRFKTTSIILEKPKAEKTIFGRYRKPKK